MKSDYINFLKHVKEKKQDIDNSGRWALVLLPVLILGMGFGIIILSLLELVSVPSFGIE